MASPIDHNKAIGPKTNIGIAARRDSSKPAGGRREGFELKLMNPKVVTIYTTACPQRLGIRYPIVIMPSNKAIKNAPI